MSERAREFGIGHGELNATIDGVERIHFETFFESERHFLTTELILPGASILDVGGGSGGLGNAIMESVQSDVRYTVIDPDPKVVALGKEMFPTIRFVDGYFPDDAPSEKFDIVLAFALFPFIPQWKEFLLGMRQFSRRYVLFAGLFKTQGAAVIDKDISYVYYLDSGERAYQVIHNIHHLINFFSIHEFKAHKISFFGYHTKDFGNNNRELPDPEIIKGVFMIDGDEDLPYRRRVGGQKTAKFARHGIEVTGPELDLNINGCKWLPEEPVPPPRWSE